MSSSGSGRNAARSRSAPTAILNASRASASPFSPTTLPDFWARSPAFSPGSTLRLARVPRLTHVASLPADTPFAPAGFRMTTACGSARRRCRNRHRRLGWAAASSRRAVAGRARGRTQPGAPNRGRSQSRELRGALSPRRRRMAERAGRSVLQRQCPRRPRSRRGQHEAPLERQRPLGLITRISP